MRKDCWQTVIANLNVVKVVIVLILEDPVVCKGDAILVVEELAHPTSTVIDEIFSHANVVKRNQSSTAANCE
jgi:hypothetical protein